MFNTGGGGGGGPRNITAKVLATTEYTQPCDRPMT